MTFASHHLKPSQWMRSLTCHRTAASPRNQTCHCSASAYQPDAVGAPQTKPHNLWKSSFYSVMWNIVLSCLQALMCLRFVSLTRTKSSMKAGLVLRPAGEPQKQQVVSTCLRHHLWCGQTAGSSTQRWIKLSRHDGSWMSSVLWNTSYV